METVAAATEAARAGLSVVLSPHGTLPYGTGRGLLKRGWDALLSPRTLGRIGHVVALTEGEAEEARVLWAARGRELGNRVSVVPNGVDPAPRVEPTERREARASLGLGEGDRVVLFLGRLHERKRIPLLVEAFGVFAGRCEAARLILAGPDDGALEEVRAALARLGLTRRVVIPGMVEGKGRREVLAAADLFALVARGEGLPVAALEALAAGLPVVLGRECRLPEVAASGAGLVVDGSVPEIASALERVVLAPDGGAGMGARARLLASERFSWPAIVAQLDGIYSGVERAPGSDA